jgi:hypothetical protein
MSKIAYGLAIAAAAARVAPPASGTVIGLRYDCGG